MFRRLGVVLRDILEAVILAAVLFVVLQLAIQNTVVEGSSMEPNFTDQEWLLVNKLAYRFGTPERGDVIVFYAPDQPEKEFIKRIIAFPTETVEIRGNVVRINGRPLEEPWSPAADARPFGPFKVPQGELFVLGDNRPRSNDSRTWAMAGKGLRPDQVVGKAWLRLWPSERFGLIRPVLSPSAASQAVPVR